MSETRGRRSGGRAARQAARLHAVVESVPFLTRTLAPFEVLVRRGPLAPRGERRHDPRGGRHRLPRRTRRALALPRRGRRRRRRASSLPARDVPTARAGDRAARVHAVRPEPGAQRRLRRREHDLRACLRLAVRPRPRRRPALRDDRGLPQLREARVRLTVAPPLRRHGLRAGRPPRQQAPLRHGRGAPALSRQAVHGIRHAPAARAGHGRHGANRLRRGLRRGEHGRLQPDQRELAARLGRDDARQRARVRGGEPGGDDDPVHPRGGDEPGHGRGDVRADARRVARRDDVRASSSGRARPSCSARSRARCRCSRAPPRSGRRSRRSSSTSWPRSHAGSAFRSARAER